MHVNHNPHRSFPGRINEISSTSSPIEQQTVILPHPGHPLGTRAGTIDYSAALRFDAEDVKKMNPSPENRSSTTSSTGSHKLLNSSNNGRDWVNEDTLNQKTTGQERSARRLAQVVAHFPQSGNKPIDPVVKALSSMRAMIQKYDSEWPCRAGRIAPPTMRECVVVTGTTGALGSHILAQLLRDEEVEKVWAMNRKSGQVNTRERQITSFEDKLLDVNLLDSEKVVFVDADLEDHKLGLHTEMYDKIRREATIIIHNAWPMNLNPNLEYFESNVHGSRNLLDLAFNSIAPTELPRFLFISSIGVAGFDHPGRLLREVPVALEDGATSIGYGQSKLVTEKLLESARQAGLQTCIIRLAQLTGDIASGSWSTTDWVASLIRSSISVGCLPGALGVVSWLPLDVAANSIVDLCVSRNAELPLVVHISHPRPTLWMDIMNSFAEAISSHIGCRLPIVRFNEWNKRVFDTAASFRGSKNERYNRFPITKLKSRLDRGAEVDDELRLRGDINNAEFSGFVTLDTSVGEALSKNLKCTPKLDIEYAEKWVMYWKSRGYLEPV